MGDSINIDWGLANAHPVNAFAALQEGRQIGQERATQGALAGFDPNAPDGGQSTVDQLVKVGALNQAAALTGMVEHRQAALRQRRLQDAQASGDLKAVAAIDPKAAIEGAAAQEAITKQAGQQQITQAIQSGDYASAWKIAAGDPDLTKAMEAISSHVAETHDLFAQYAGPAKQLPVDQRAAYIQQQEPQLLARGISKGEIDQFLANPQNLTNEGLDAFLQSTQTAKEQLAAHKPVPVAAGGSLLDPITGEVVAHAPDKPDKPHATAVPGVTDANGNPVFYDSNATPEEAARQARGGGGSNPALTEQHMQGVIGQILPGAVITSGARSPEHNAEVGGVPNSLHLAGEAMDFKKPPGETLESIRQKLQAHNMPITELIDEGTHIHWGWGAKADAAGASGKPASAGAVDTTLTGDAYLKQLDPTMQARVKAVTEGRMAIPGGSKPNPYWQAVVNNAVLYDPTFEAGDNNVRVKTRNAFTNGAESKTLTSLRTAIAHVDRFDKSIDEMGNTGLPLNNWAAHGIADRTGTNKRFADFRSDRLAIATELTKALRGTSGAEADIQAWLKLSDENQSPEYLHKINTNLINNLLRVRFNQLQNQYDTGMGSISKGLATTNPDAADIMVRMSKREPVDVNTPEEVMKLPPGTHFLTPDGRVKVRP